LGGEIQETSKKCVLKAINDQDVIQEVSSSSIYFQSLITNCYPTPYSNENIIRRMINYKKYSMNAD